MLFNFKASDHLNFVELVRVILLVIICYFDWVNRALEMFQFSEQSMFEVSRTKIPSQKK